MNTFTVSTTDISRITDWLLEDHFYVVDWVWGDAIDMNYIKVNLFNIGPETVLAFRLMFVE
jgi:hypothetical protein